MGLMSLRVELFVSDLDASAAFYTDVLGFTLARSDAAYRSLVRGAAVLGLGPRADDPRRNPTVPGAGIEVVIEIDGGPEEIDALHAHVHECGAAVAGPPTDQPWGLRDFRLVDPDGYYLRVTHRGGDAAPARTPEPPYTAVIFTSMRTDLDHAGYATAAAEMDRLAAAQPGYLGVESAKADLGITVSYWTTPAAALAWKAVAEHELAQESGRARWYRTYRVRVATVERDYGF
jgi:heme-degrading monooxygenase HmoA/predicted enzyme related to lactoylglutathione lyase